MAKDDVSLEAKTSLSDIAEALNSEQEFDLAVLLIEAMAPWRQIEVLRRACSSQELASIAEAFCAQKHED